MIYKENPAINKKKQGKNRKYAPPTLRAQAPFAPASRALRMPRQSRGLGAFEPLRDCAPGGRLRRARSTQILYQPLFSNTVDGVVPGWVRPTAVSDTATLLLNGFTGAKRLHRCAAPITRDLFTVLISQ